MRTVLGVILMFVLAWFAPGCASVPAIDDDPLAGVPEDFSLELTVLPGRNVQPPRRVEQQAGRFVVFADGSLHYDEEVRDRRVRRAGLIRRLDRDEQADLWLLLRRLNFSDAERAEPSINLDRIEAQPSETLHQLAIIANDRRWVYLHRSSPEDEIEPAMRDLITHLAALCWLPEEPPPDRGIIPRRYHFGPDPYARYRR